MGSLKRVAFLVLLSFGIAYGDGISSRLNIEETDGSPSTYPYKLKVTDGSLTDNGDGTATLVTGAGVGGSGGDSFGSHTATKTVTAGYGIVTTTVSATAFNATTTSMSVTGAGGFSTTYGITAGSVTVNGAGDGEITLTIGADDYLVTATSTTPVAFECAYWTSANTLDGKACGSGSGTPSDPVNSVQFNSAGSFGGSGNFNWSGTSMSVLAQAHISSMTTIGSSSDGTNLISRGWSLFGTGSYGGTSSSTLTVFNTVPAGQATRLASFGTDQALNQVVIANETAVDMNYGVTPGNLTVGASATPYKIKNIQNTNEVSVWEAGNTAIHLRTSAADNGPIVLAPSFSTAVYINNAGGATFSSSATFNHANGVKVLYGVDAGSVAVADDAYAAGWNGSLLVPTKNAVYDKIESLAVGGGGASTLAVSTGATTGYHDPAISSPTAVLAFRQEQFSVSLQDAATAFVQINLSSITALGQTPPASFIGAGTLGATVLVTSVAVNTINNQHIKDGDHGDFTYASGAATLDADVVAAAEMADADHGDVTWSGGVASVEDDSHAHTSSSLSGIDISADTNLAVAGQLYLDNDTLSVARVVIGSGTVGAFDATTTSATATGDFRVAGNVSSPLTATSSVTVLNAARFGAAGSAVQITSNTVLVGTTFYHGGNINLGWAGASIFVSTLTASLPVRSDASSRLVAMQIQDSDIADSAVDGGSGGEITDNSVNASDIDETSNYAWTGVHDFGGGVLEVPNGTGPTIDATGECAFDTTDGIWACYDGESAKVVGYSTHSVTVTISSGTGWNGLSLVAWRAPADMAVTITQIRAESLTTGTTVKFQLDETTFGGTASAGTDVFSVQFSSAHNQGVTTTSFSNAGIAAGNSLVFNTPAAGAAGGTPAAMSFTIYYKRDRE